MEFIVSVTVLVVSVVEVIAPCVKLGTTGTDIAVGTFARADTTATITSFFFVIMHFLILVSCQVIEKIIYHINQSIVNSFMNCPVATVPAPPAVSVTAPADVIVPAKSPAVPDAVDV